LSVVAGPGIQPLGDMNQRMARAIANKIRELLQA
jgi:hypothetical protein